MAEGFFNHYGKEKFNVVSAGINPITLHPLAIQVIKEAGVDISAQTSKPVSQFLAEIFDYVITVCDNAKQTCPPFAIQNEKIHRDIDDPAQAKGSDDEKLRVFREIRDKIKTHVLKFIATNPH